MRMGNNDGKSKIKQPNRFCGPTQSDAPYDVGFPTRAAAGHHPWKLHSEDNDFLPGGDLYRNMGGAEKARLVDNITVGISRVSNRETF